jgi:hypothetical protein
MDCNPVLRFNISDTQMTRTARFTILVLTTILLLVLGSPPLLSQEQEGDQVAIGFIHPDGQTGLSYPKVEGHEQPEPIYGMASAVPSEPPGHRLVYLTNLERVSRGVPPLKAAPELMAAAQFHSDWMASHNCFRHNCSGEPGWVARIVNAGYLNYELLGENIAGGQSTASAAISAWMGSAGHRANMLNPGFREAGGGYAYSASARYRHYWTMDFGSRRDDQGDPVYPLVINNEAWSTTSAQVDLYLHGGGWANEMRFRNENGAWSPWEPFSANKSWTLACGTPAKVYAEIKQGSMVLEASDEIHLDVPLTVLPNPLIFLSEQGATPTVPQSYWLAIAACETWSAEADETWIKLGDTTGTGLSSGTTVYLQGFAQTPPVQTGTITVQTETSQEQVDVQVTLVVTDGPLKHSYAPLVAK